MRVSPSDPTDWLGLAGRVAVVTGAGSGIGERSDCINGEDIMVDGGVSRVLMSLIPRPEPKGATA